MINQMKYINYLNSKILKKSWLLQRERIIQISSKNCESYLQEKGDVETEVGELAKHEAPEGEGEVHPGDEHDHCGEVAGGLAGVRHLAHGDQDQQVDETQDYVEYLDPVVHLVQIPDNVVLSIIFLFSTTLLLPQV